MSGPVIEVEQLSKTFRRFRKQPVWALERVTLAIPSGCAFGLIGPNGAGKTTLIKILLGVARPTSGTVRLWGQSPDEPKVRARIGYLPERLHLPATWTPPAFLQSVARLKGLPTALPSLLALLGRVGLSDSVGRRIGGFSKGMRQRLGLAAALLGQPDLLVLDEPTDGIDPLGRLSVRELLLQEKARGATVLLNSHLLSETERVCDRIGILADGKLAREGTLDSLRTHAHRYQVQFGEGADTQLLQAAGFTESQGGWSVEAKNLQELDVALARARAGGALLCGLQRSAKDLEEVLTDAVGTQP